MTQDPNRNGLLFYFEGKRALTTQLGQPNENNLKLCIFQSNECSVEFFALNLELVCLSPKMWGGRKWRLFVWDLQGMRERRTLLLHLYTLTLGLCSSKDNATSAWNLFGNLHVGQRSPHHLVPNTVLEFWHLKNASCPLHGILPYSHSLHNLLLYLLCSNTFLGA